MKITIDIPDIDTNEDRLETFTKTSYIALLAVYSTGLWKNRKWDNLLVASTTRLFYDQVFTFKKDGFRSGYTSMPSELVGSLTADHFLSPQTVAEFILDTPKYFDYNLYRKLFKCCCSTHTVAGKKFKDKFEGDQNIKLSKLKRTTLTKFKYKELDIMLYDEWGNEVDNIIKPIEYVCDEFWEEYCEWENVNILDVPSKYNKSFTQIRPINLEQFYSC
tara:strand:- start:373 stop:1026 length:654 start_codon:yes stop_codon:yes gene_type:complete